MHSNRRKLSGASNSFIPPHSLGFKNAKINFFEDKEDLSAVFIELKCGWLQIYLTDMKKHKTLEKLLRADFYAFLKYCIFRYFLKIISGAC